MSNNNNKHTHNADTKTGAEQLKPLMVQHLANQMKLEELSTLVPNDDDNTEFDNSISNLMSQQEKLLEELNGFEIQNAADAKRILNIWISEAVNPNDVSREQQLIFSVYRFLENHAV